MDPLKIMVCTDESLQKYGKVLQDNIIDIDLTAYISNNPMESSKKVGYGNHYVETNYIKWFGDKIQVTPEYIEVNVEKYKEDYYENYKQSSTLELTMNVCWNENSQVNPDDIYLMINWKGILEKVSLTALGISSFDCKTRSIVITIDLKTFSLKLPLNIFYILFNELSIKKFKNVKS